MLDVGAGEFIALAIVAMIVLGPEKLPRYAAEAARFLQRLRAMAGAARADVRRELGPEFEDISLRDLNPRSMVRKHLLDPIDIDSLDGSGSPGTGKPAARRGPGDPPAEPGPARYDPDTT
jgi:sec-independent protein translocase protein TatB